MIFAPLHIISGYSFLQSGLTIEKIKKAVKENDYFGAAVSDINVLYGVPKFVKMMDEINKPYLIGIEISLNGDNISIYALNDEGYKNLCLLSSLLNKEMDVSSFLKNNHQGLLGILSTNEGHFKDEFSKEIDSKFTKYLLNISRMFDSFYLGIEVTSKDEVHYANKVRKFAAEYTYTTIAFPRILYLNKEDAIILDIVHAIKEDENISVKEKTGQHYFMKEADYSKIYSKAELSKTIELLKSSTLSFAKKRGEMLHYHVEDSVQTLKDNVYNGLKEKSLSQEEYLKRAEYEIGIITSMGFADYFLIVQDFIKHAEDVGILVGPGRGSAAGSLVSYALGITKVDPIKYNLQFERFLNPGRKTMPDIDVDFMDTRRNEVIDYMREKYGENRVAQISTFQTIMAKQAIRDIGRIYDEFSSRSWLIDNLSKTITDPKLTLADAYRKLPAFKKLVDSDHDYLQIVSLARKIEGLPRQNGLHAAGVILNNTPMESSLPVTYDIDGHYVTQYESIYLEEQGFLKMDFLSLRNLTTIDYCVKLINENHQDVSLDPKHIDFDKPETYELISKGQLTGIFQLESAGMKRAIKTIRPSRFEDVVAVISLFRPGPMASIPTYARRKHGEEPVTYLSNDLKEVLEDTYGVLTYQEQVTGVAVKMAGFSVSEADLFRRGISKKKADVLKAMEAKFLEGCKKKGYSDKVSKTVYDAIMKFANYGFNKSHAAVYAYIACEMAYLKSHYPLEFYASIMMTASSTSDSKFSEYVSEMRSRNIPVYVPDINHSEKNFIIYNNGLLYPLGEIRGITYILVNNILEERKENGPFTDFFSFIVRMFKYGISESSLEHLIRAGVFDSLNPSRASLLASIGKGLQYADLISSGQGQVLLDDSLLPPPSIIEVKDNPLDNLNDEYEALGIMLSSNPLSYRSDLYDKYDIVSLNEANEHKGNFKIMGIVKSVKIINTKKGTPMAFIKLFDQTSEFEVTIFSDLYSDNMRYIKKNNILLIEGSNKNNQGESSFIASKIELIEN